MIKNWEVYLGIAVVIIIAGTMVLMGYLK